MRFWSGSAPSTYGRRYRGRFAEYDLNNEMLHGNYYEQRLGTNITLRMAQWVREADPQAVLYLNDYDILTGKRLEDYLRHIRTLLAQGVPIGGIGVQGHLHGDTFDAQALHHARPEALDDHVGALDHPEERSAPRGRLQIERVRHVPAGEGGRPEVRQHAVAAAGERRDLDLFFARGWQQMARCWLRVAKAFDKQ